MVKNLWIAAGRWLLALLAFLLLLACAPKPTPTPTPPPPLSFNTEDGVTLRGHIFGQGEKAVILAHMYPADQRSWFDFARILASRGYQVLTFDFRGYGESSGAKDIPQIDKDVEAAVRLMQGRAERIYLVGASMGGTASVMVAGRGQLPIAAIVSLSAPVEFMGLDAQAYIGKLSLPSLFLASEGDKAAAEAAYHYYNYAPGPKEVRVFPGIVYHGSDMVQSVAVREVIIDFLKRYSE